MKTRLLFLVVVIYCCSSEDINTSHELPSCLLLEISLDNESGDEAKSLFWYDSLGRLTRIFYTSLEKVHFQRKMDTIDFSWQDNNVTSVKKYHHESNDEGLNYSANIEFQIEYDDKIITNVHEFLSGYPENGTIYKFMYGNKSEILRVTVSVDGINTYEISNEYDLAGNIKETTTSYSYGIEKITFEYDNEFNYKSIITKSLGGQEALTFLFDRWQWARRGNISRNNMTREFVNFTSHNYGPENYEYNYELTYNKSQLPTEIIGTYRSTFENKGAPITILYTNCN